MPRPSIVYYQRSKEELVPDSLLSHRSSKARPLRVLVLVLPFLFCISANLVAATPSPAFTFVNPLLQLPIGDSGGPGILILKAEGLQADPLHAAPRPKVEDLGIPSPPAIKVIFEPGEPAVGPTSVLWQIKTTVTGVPSGTTQKRTARVILGTVESLVEYTLSNTSPVSFGWTVQPPPAAWSLVYGQPASIAIAVGPVPATDVTLASCGFVEQSTKKPLGCDRLKLCTTSSDTCTPLPTLSSGVHSLFLRAEGAIDPGIYQGSFNVSAREIPQGSTLSPITLYSTSLTYQIWGVVFLLIGVALAWFVTSFARTRIARDQALLPVAMLRAQLDDLMATLAGAPQAYRQETSQTESAIQNLKAKLTDAALSNFLPPRSPLPFGSSGDAGGLKALLESLNGPVAQLTAIVREGLVPAWKNWQPGMAPAAEAAIGAAVHDIDALSTTPGLTLEQVRDRIHVRLDALNRVLHPAPLAAILPPIPARPSSPPLSFERLSLDIARLSSSVWIIWFLITGLTGSAALVFSNLGFGVPMDYVQCLLWGFGIPAAGQTLTQITAGSVSTALGVSIVKS